uniref:SPRY domain containing SOCS box protein-1 n=1 Tax=Schmidtea mediterranea TaxID=79327 RepID=I1ZI79_SCHMD|nr:SPRY domain containing SOCS box protein-1 [Schmidtea mediterranea]
MPEHDECEFCMSSKRMRTSYRSNSNNNNNLVTVSRHYYDKCPPRLLQLMDIPHFTYKMQLAYAWNPLDSSINIDVKLIDPLTLHRHPVAQSTDSIRGKIGFNRGFHMWRIDWKLRERGTHAVVGVCTKDAPLHCHGYCSLIGLTEESWGWDIIRKKLVHKQSVDVEDQTYPVIIAEDICSLGDAIERPNTNIEVQESIFVLLDMEEGTLSFINDGQYLGVAFSGLKGRTLYPAISAVWGHCEVTMAHLASLNPLPLPLLHLCRFYIRKHLRINVARNFLQMDDAVNYDLSMKIDQLNIPEYLKMYLKNGSF